MMNYEEQVIGELTRLTVWIPVALEMLGIGRSKLYELMGSGEIQVIKIGKATLILVQSLHSFVHRQRSRDQSVWTGGIWGRQ